MAPTVEQAAELITTQRNDKATRLFESTYAELLPALKGSKLAYEATTDSEGTTHMRFSRADLHTLLLPVVAEGKLAKKDSGAELGPEALTTLLADYIVSEEQRVVKKEAAAQRVKAYSRWWKILCAVLVLCVVAVVCLAVAGPEWVQAGFDAIAALFVVVFMGGVVLSAALLGALETMGSAS